MIRAGALALAAALMSASPPGWAAEARLTPLAFEALDGWPEDDHGAALTAFRRTCAAILDHRPALRPAAGGDDLKAVCAASLADPAAREPRRFFERWFEPVLVEPGGGPGFLTGYYEPEVEGSRSRTDAFPTPLYGRPADLVSARPGETFPGLDPALQAARRGPGGFEPYPDRTAIEEGALDGLAEPVAFVRDAPEAFIIQVQGSARLRLPDGTVIRVAYAGRNGHPYTSIGRLLVARGAIPLEEMSLERLMGWLRANPAEAREVMRANRSFVFFRLADELDAGDGPIGGAGIPLTPGRSLAVDRALWSYGLPVWLEGTLPEPDGGSAILRRLVIAQDTGTAIVGPARGDFFVGSGPEAGTRAGLIRHPVRFVVLRPRPAPLGEEPRP